MQDVGVRAALSAVVSFNGDEAGARLRFAGGSTDHADTLCSALGLRREAGLRASQARINARRANAALWSRSSL
jgi:hypothetical protein